MRTLGIILVVVGTLGALSSYVMDTAPSGTHNFGLIADRIAGVVFFSAMAIVGAIFFGIGAVAGLAEIFMSPGQHKQFKPTPNPWAGHDGGP